MISKKYKFCNICKRKEPSSQWRKDKDKEGYLCDTCYYRENRRSDGSNRESVKKYQRENREKYLESHRESAKKYRQKHREKVKAHKIIEYAIKIKEIESPEFYDCFCGTRAKEYHHLDYSRPKLVVPICKEHHELIHLKNKFEEI